MLNTIGEIVLAGLLICKSNSCISRSEYENGIKVIINYIKRPYLGQAPH